ncbi:MAG: hypothetical protein JSV38_08720 [Desulfobacterales bacterium]|nr:MAG: hypothetical protein JSV38_08720 [Desulfobacterales bacterium]
MDTTINGSNDKLASTSALFKMAYQLSSDKNKLHDYAVAFIIPVVVSSLFFGIAFCLFIIFPDKETLIFLIPVPIILLFLLVAFLGILSSFNFQRKLSYDEIIIQGFKLLFPFLWLALLNVFIILFGLCLLIIPGIFWGIRFSLSIGILAFEGQKGFKALTRSKALTQHHFFYLLLNYGACGAVTLVILLAVLLIFPGDTHTILNFARIFIIIFSAIFASAFYYNLFNQLSSRYQLAAGESSSEAEDPESKTWNSQNLRP